jgi:hypothetical protein
MAPVDHDRWQALSPYLDEALEIADADARIAWLASLRQENSVVAAELDILLTDHRALERDGFLERIPAGFPTRTFAGQTIGGYTVVSPIGQGGMGSVWLAERSDGRFDRRVAIKFLSVALAERGGERFKREGSILARLAHPRIAQLVDAGVSGAAAVSSRARRRRAHRSIAISMAFPSSPHRPVPKCSRPSARARKAIVHRDLAVECSWGMTAM